MLVNYKTAKDGRAVAARRSLRTELASLFDEAILRGCACGFGRRAG